MCVCVCVCVYVCVCVSMTMFKKEASLIDNSAFIYILV